MWIDLFVLIPLSLLTNFLPLSIFWTLSVSLSLSLSLSQNLAEGKYKTFEEFKADAQLIVHNTAILYGGKLYTCEHVDLCCSHCAINLPRCPYKRRDEGTVLFPLFAFIVYINWSSIAKTSWNLMWKSRLDNQTGDVTPSKMHCGSRSQSQHFITTSI